MFPTLRRTSNLPDLVDEFFGKDFLNNFLDLKTTGVNMPAINVVEEKDEYKIEVAAPGLEKKDFKIDLNHNVLTISSEKEFKKEEKDKKYMRREFNYTSFKRSFTLPDSVNVDKISASHKDGILNITIPKKEEAKVRPIKEINIS